MGNMRSGISGSGGRGGMERFMSDLPDVETEDDGCDDDQSCSSSSTSSVDVHNCELYTAAGGVQTADNKLSVKVSLKFRGGSSATVSMRKSCGERLKVNILSPEAARRHS